MARDLLAELRESLIRARADTRTTSPTLTEEDAPVTSPTLDRAEELQRIAHPEQHGSARNT